MHDELNVLDVSLAQMFKLGAVDINPLVGERVSREGTAWLVSTFPCVCESELPDENEACGFTGNKSTIIIK